MLASRAGAEGSPKTARDAALAVPRQTAQAQRPPGAQSSCTPQTAALGATLCSIPAWGLAWGPSISSKPCLRAARKAAGLSPILPLRTPWPESNDVIREISPKLQSAERLKAAGALKHFATSFVVVGRQFPARPQPQRAGTGIPRGTACPQPHALAWAPADPLPRRPPDPSGCLSRAGAGAEQPTRANSIPGWCPPGAQGEPGGRAAPHEVSPHDVPAGRLASCLLQVPCSQPLPGWGGMRVQEVPCFGRGGYFLLLVFLFLSKSPRC